MQPHLVAIAALEDRFEGVHPAYLDPTEDWNGRACPYFERAEVERMAAWLPEYDDRSSTTRSEYCTQLVPPFYESGTVLLRKGYRINPSTLSPPPAPSGLPCTRACSAP